MTADEEARAAVIEARIVAEEAAAEAVRTRSTVRRRDPETAAAPRASGSIAQRAAEEYAYVGRDVRRITVIGGSLLLLMVVLWIIANASGASAI